MGKTLVASGLRSAIRVFSFWTAIILALALAIVKAAGGSLTVKGVPLDSQTLQTLLITLVVMYIVTLAETIKASQDSLETSISSAKDSYESAISLLEANQSTVHNYSSFDQGAIQWLTSITKEQIVEELLICAFTGISFQKILRQAPAHSIKNIRILLFIERGTLSRDGKELDINELVKDWDDLKNLAPHVENISIKHIRANLQAYFSIADREEMLWGWLHPRGSLPNLHTDRCWIASSQHVSTKRAIESQADWFESYWEFAEDLE